MTHQAIFTADRNRIFQDMEYTDACSDLHCHCIALVGKHSTPVCDGNGPDECPRVRLLADDIKDMIARYDHMFQYIIKL